MLMVLSFSLRHGLPTVAMLDLCKLINCLFEEDVINTSEYWFTKTFGKSLPYRVHIYCSDCEAYVADTKDIGKDIRLLPCTACSKNCSVSNLNDGYFFLTLDIRPQIVDLLETTPDIMQLINYRKNLDPSSNLRDIYDSAKYKELCEEGNFLSNQYNFSCTISTDGVSIFESTKNTGWPILMRLNELPPSYRFSQNNFMLGGMWFGKKDPNMMAFLSPFLRELNDLYRSGFHWKSPKGDKIHSKLIVFNCVLDSVAKPLVQCVKQFNEYYGCGYCLHPGCVLDEGSNHAKYIMPDNDLFLMNDLSFEYSVTQKQKNGQEILFHVKDRTNDSMRSNMEQAEILRERDPKADIKGVKGLSSLYILASFDLVFGFGIDWLHAICLGVVKTVANLWFDSTSKGKNYYLNKAKRKLVNINLAMLQLPGNLRRRDLTIDERTHWKGNEWRTWLLHVSLPVLMDLLPSTYLKHHCVLVSAIYILLKDEIEPDELDEATWLCGQYVTEFQELYGGKNMHYNVHLLLHIGKCVKIMGPLWSFSLFSFESFDGSLVRLVKGTRGVMTQIAHKYSRFKNIPRAIQVYGVSQNVKSFCSSLLTCRLVTISSKVNGVTLLDSEISVPLLEAEIRAFEEAAVMRTNLCFERMIKDGIKYHATCYRRKGKKSNDTLVMFVDGTYGSIQRIVQAERNNIPEVFVLVQIVSTEINDYIVRHTASGAKCPHIKICSHIVFGQYGLKQVHLIRRKSIFIHTQDAVYLSDFPNMFETD